MEQHTAAVLGEAPVQSDNCLGLGPLGASSFTRLRHSSALEAVAKKRRPGYKTKVASHIVQTFRLASHMFTSDMYVTDDNLGARRPVDRLPARSATGT